MSRPPSGCPSSSHSLGAHPGRIRVGGGGGSRFLRAPPFPSTFAPLGVSPLRSGGEWSEDSPKTGEGGGKGCDRVHPGRSLDPRGGRRGYAAALGWPIRGSGWGVAGGRGLVLVIVITPPPQSFGKLALQVLS